MMLLTGLIIAGCATTQPPPARPDSAPKPMAAPQAQSVAAEADKRDDQAIAAVDLEKSVFFATGKSELDTKAKMLLHQHAERLKANPKQRVLLVGYTDDRGSSAYNIAIADMRVNAVYQWLREQGVPVKQLRRYSAGGEKNSSDCRSDECRQLMRRVELDYDPK
ncbi:MAG: OmpA family protein [Rhodocyclaceae bacterium]|nr:OmpA family protein [Rhodocyclaceae bacterium]